MRTKWLDACLMMMVYIMIQLAPCTALFLGAGTAASFLRDNVVREFMHETIIGKIRQRTQQARTKPLMVVLNEVDTSSTVHRRAQYDFTVETPVPTFVPTIRPSRQPSLAPSVQPSNDIRNNNGQPTEAVQVETSRPASTVVISKSTKDTPAPFQPLKFAAVPVGFDVMLETESQQDLEIMAQQAKKILEDHLTQNFQEGFDDQGGILVSSVDLNVKAFLTRPSRRGRMLNSLSRFLQFLRAITLEARGVAGFQVNRAVDTPAFLRQVNAIIDESVNPERLMDLFQDSTSGLSDYRVAGVTNTENNGEEGPTIIEIVIALLLIVLMAAGLVGYAYVFWKKRKKRLKRRKQFGVGHKPPTSLKATPTGRPHGASVTPTASAGIMTSTKTLTMSRPSYPTGEMDSSSSESSYKGLGSESEEERTDNFAKELRLAASLDRRAWDDFQHRKQQFAGDHGSDIEEEGNLSNYSAGNGVYKDLASLDMPPAAGIGMEERMAGAVYGMSDELPSPRGAVGLTVTGDTVSIQSNSSFPYGDENDKADYLPKSLYGNNVDSAMLQNHQGGAYMTSKRVVERDDSSGGWRMTESSDFNKSLRRNPPPFSFLYHSSEAERDAEAQLSNHQQAHENVSDPSSGGAVRGSPMSQSWSTNPRASSSTDNATNSAVRGSPQSSSWNSAVRPLSSDQSLAGSPASGSTGAVIETTASVAGSEEESMLTADIVREVQRLSQFVKSYERKKENRVKREMQREEGVDLSASLASSLEYDSVMDTLPSLQEATGDQNISGGVQPPLTGKVNSLSRHNLNSKQSAAISPDRNLPSSGKERDIPRIDSIPSSDSSGIETMESDDLSRRLGIHPFSVQKPAGYQYPKLQNPSSAPTNSQTIGDFYRTERSPQQTSQATRGSGNSEKQQVETSNTFREITRKFSNKASAPAAALASLRQSDAILDGSIKEDLGPSDESGEAQNRRADRHQPFDPAPLRDPRLVTPRKRSQNRGFNSIVSMFESKEREPIYPPNESWQYNY